MARFDFGKAHPEVYRAMNGTVLKSRRAAHGVGLTDDILELINVRVSQLNGCVACLGAHVPALREAGMAQELIDLIPVWRDPAAPFTPAQRAALEIAESLTIMDNLDRDAVVDAALEHYTSEQVAALEWATVLINAYNRISIGSGHGAKL